MCYTPQISLQGFIINLLGCLILLKYPNKDLKIIAYSLLFVSLMQIYDYIFWKTQSLQTHSQKTINKITTKLAMFTNHLQPIILLFIILYFNKSIKKLSLILTLFYILLAIFYSFEAYHKIEYTVVTEKSKPSLDWQWNSLKYYNQFYTVYFIAIMGLFLQNLKNPNNIYMALFISLAFLFSMNKYSKQISTGRFWCFYVSFIPFIILFLNKI